MKSQSDRISHSVQSTLLRYLRTSARKMSIGVQLAGTIGLLGVAGSFSLGQTVSAQTAITSIVTNFPDQTQEEYITTTATPCDNTKVFACDAAAKILFGSGTNDNLNLDSVTAGGTTFTYRGLADKIQIKRINNPRVSGDRQIMFFQNNSAADASTTAPIAPITFNVAPSRVDTMESVLLSNTINRGADNVFANDAPSSNKSKNFNNIERIDYIINNGISAPTTLDAADIGFVVMDRGSRDKYAIAPILSLDASGNPATVGDVQVFDITLAIANTAQDYLVLRREAMSSLLRPSDRSGAQTIGGHFVSLSKLFLSSAYVPNTKVYGYVLMAPDAPTTSTDVVNLTKFSINSEAGNTTGGIDLIAGGGIFSKNPLPIVTSGASVSGTIFNDVSGNKLQDGTEPIVNGSTLALNAVLFDVTANKVFAVTQVSATGTYSFGNVTPGNYTVILTTAAASVSGPMPTVTLPANYVTTGENLNGTVETTPATPDSKIAVTVAAANITNLNFGIEQLPNAIGATAATQPNPSGTNSVLVPTNLFTTSTDSDTGTVTQYRITAFPANATSIEIDNVIYTTSGGNSTTAFPTATGVTVLATTLNTIKVDPIDGAVNVTIPFKAIDNAGKESTNTANAIVPFSASLVAVSGTVFDDGNGNRLQAAGTEPSVNGTTLGLKAVLVSNNQVIATVAVSATGTYTFNGVSPGNYTVLITTNTPTGTTVPAIALPTNWITTGENLNGTVENTPDSRQSITVASTTITGVNFGLEQLPTAIGATATSQPNPRNAVSVDVPPALFNTSTDLDGTVDQYRITSFPSNATSITIDGVVYTPVTGLGTIAFPSGGVIIPTAKLNTIKVDPNVDSVVNVTILFKAIDNFGQESSNTGSAVVPFTAGATPELILLKRITKINGTTTGKTLTGATIDLTQVVANPANPASQSADASNPNWPTVNYPQGAIDAGAIKSGDTIEYTIYFLSNGKAPVTNANFCDWVPKNTTFVPDAYGLGRGIQLAIGSLLNTFTNVPDGDRGVFYNPGVIPPATYPNANTFKLNCMSPAGVEGAVVVNLVNNALAAPENQLPNATAAGTPGNSYGFVRFVSKVK